MGFLSSVVVPNTTGTKIPSAVGSGSFLKSVSVPDVKGQAQAEKIAGLQQKEAAAKEASRKANSVGGVLKDTVMGLPSATGIGQMARDSFNVATGALVDAGTGKSTTGGLKEGFDLVSGVGGVVFSPLAPLINPISQLIHGATNVVGNLTHTTLPDIAQKVGLMSPAQRLKYDARNNVPQSETADKILTTLQSAGNAAMALIGAKGRGAKGKVDEVPPRPGDGSSGGPPPGPLGTKIPVKGESVETPVSFANKYETPGTIQIGPKAAESLPVAARSPISKAAEMGKIPGFKYEPVKTGTSEVPVAAKTETAPVSVVTEAPIRPLETSSPVGVVKTSTGNLKPLEGTGPVKTRGVSLSAEAEAIEAGLTENFGALPEYKTANFKEISQKVAEIVVRDMETAKQIAMGEKPAPKGTIPEMFWRTLVDQAKKEGDAQTIYDLANSKLAESGTTMGQRIAAYGYGKKAGEDPVDLVREVQRLRTEALERRNAETPVKITTRVKAAVRKTNTKQTWGDFVNSITC